MRKNATSPSTGLEITLDARKFAKAVRLKRLQEGLSLRALDQLVGVSYPTLCRIEQGNDNKPDIEHMLALCHWLRQPPEMFFSGAPNSLRVRRHYQTYVNAGKPAPTEEEAEYRDLNEDLMPDYDGYFSVTAKGDSMIGARIYDGDLLIAKTGAAANPGDIVIAVINNDYCVKRYEVKRGAVVLRSANPDYSDIPINKTDDFSVRGVVTHSIHRHQRTGQAIV